MEVYFAGPLFTTPERTWNAELDLPAASTTDVIGAILAAFARVQATSWSGRARG